MHYTSMFDSTREKHNDIMVRLLSDGVHGMMQSDRREG